ncbi:hypothetical protein DESC_610024 [Desulfosarcina cetonica]|nr:hypothetical protein DESC_610024 [Desulfosarcina cetonica]
MLPEPVGIDHYGGAHRDQHQQAKAEEADVVLDVGHFVHLDDGDQDGQHVDLHHSPFGQVSIGPETAGQAVCESPEGQSEGDDKEQGQFHQREEDARGHDHEADNIIPLLQEYAECIDDVSGTFHTGNGEGHDRHEHGRKIQQQPGQTDGQGLGNAVRHGALDHRVAARATQPVSRRHRARVE